MRGVVLLVSVTNTNPQHKVHQPKQDISKGQESTTEKTKFNIKLLPKSLTYAKLLILAEDPF